MRTDLTRKHTPVLFPGIFLLLVLSILLLPHTHAYADNKDWAAGPEDLVLSGLTRKNDNLYYYKNGKKITNSLVHVKGSYYFFNKSGKALRSTWKKINAKKYYFQDDAKAAVGSCRIDGHSYIFGDNAQLITPASITVTAVGGEHYLVKNGLAVSGWHYLNGKVYYAGKTGQCAADKKVSYIKFNKNGYAKNTDQALVKILAREFIDEHCKKSMSQQEKFKKCFRYIMAYTHYVPGSIQPKEGEKNWQYRAAIRMFQTDLTGNCYGIASTVAAVAKELGYTPYEIWAGDHAFVVIDGKYYDNMNGAKFAATTHRPYTVREKFKF